MRFSQPSRNYGHDFFTARQLREKCRKEPRELYVIFVDLTKTFHSVDRTALWKVLLKVGCPPGFVNIIRSFHDDMRAAVVENGEMSADFDVTNDTKQGCVLAPLLFIIFFAMMLRVTFSDCAAGVPIHYHTDGVWCKTSACEDQSAAGRPTRSAFCKLLCVSCPHVKRRTDFVWSVQQRRQTVWINRQLEEDRNHVQSCAPHTTASASITAEVTRNDGALKSVVKFCYVGMQLFVQHRLSRQRHHIPSCQGRQRIRQTLATNVGSASHILENKDCRLPSCGVDESAVWLWDLDSLPAINPQIGPALSPLSAQDSSRQVTG